MRAVPAGPSPGADAAARRPPLRERVVGIVVTRGSVHPVTNLDKVPAIFASTALLHQLGRAYTSFDGAYVKLRPGHSPGIAGRQAEALAQRFRATGGHVFVADESAQAAAVERSIRPEAVSLALFALVLAITALLVVGQAATRLIAAAQPANPVLAALGMTRGQLMAAGLLEVGVAAAAGAVAAVGLAVAASPLMPIGTARLAEPDPGVSADCGGAHGGGGCHRGARRGAGGAAGLAPGVGRQWRPAAAAASAGRSKVAEWLAAAGAPVTAAAGVRLALEPGRGRTAVPVRSALTGAALSVLAVTAAFTFGANLLHLVHTPRLYGQDLGRRRRLAVRQLHAAAGATRAGRRPGHHRLELRQSRDDRDRRPRRSRDRGGRGPGPVAVTDPARGPPAAYRPRNRARHGHDPADRPDRRADGHRNRRRSSAGRSHRGPRRLPELRPGRLHADRSRRGRRDHHSGAGAGAAGQAARRAACL